MLSAGNILALNTNMFKVKGWKRIYLANYIHKKTGVGHINISQNSKSGNTTKD